MMIDDDDRIFESDCRRSRSTDSVSQFRALNAMRYRLVDMTVIMLARMTHVLL